MTSKDHLGDMAKSMLEEPEKVLTQLLKDIEACRKSGIGLSKVLSNWDDTEWDADKSIKMLRTSVKIGKRQNEIITRLLLINLVYAQGSNFSVDAAGLLNKFGRGVEALRSMFKRKMEGK